MRRFAAVAPLAVAAALVGLAPRLAGAIHACRPAADRGERLYYPEGAFLREASLGYAAAVADWAWLEAIQYYGGYRRGEHDLRYFNGLVDAVTTLDPRFVEVYRFASLVRSLDDADFAGALDVLKRGIVANPADWRLHFDVGFIHYVFLRDYPAASRWFEAAARLPGSTDFCRRFAAFSRRRAGDLSGSLMLWENLRQTTDSADMRELASRMADRCRQELADRAAGGAAALPAPPGAGGTP
ncbi:MAG TPA: hypothetical protein PLL30_06760 [Candidatus Krumholzibacteria bacterium]|nr:hypothetical protein [Candidatus Krumholzibacteria bacterium]HPD71462.1 hypothetical protein [Candidatus Krumholzibacteria bacterium]HRY41605.1 hypothetical protein [Candidatus Krumholzibacteria bacterium]